jgi:hypothetical protein
MRLAIRAGVGFPRWSPWHGLAATFGLAAFSLGFAIVTATQLARAPAGSLSGGGAGLPECVLPDGLHAAPGASAVPSGTTGAAPTLAGTTAASTASGPAPAAPADGAASATARPGFDPSMAVATDGGAEPELEPSGGDPALAKNVRLGLNRAYLFGQKAWLNDTIREVEHTLILDPATGRDPAMIETLLQMLTRRRSMELAQLLLVRAGADALPYLEGASHGRDEDLARRAKQLHQQQAPRFAGVDLVALLRRHAEHGRTCAGRRLALLRLAARREKEVPATVLAVGDSGGETCSLKELSRKLLN